MFYSLRLSAAWALILIVAVMQCATGAPSIRIADEDIELGMVEWGDHAPLDIVCNNDGNEELLVEVSNVSCGACTYARGSNSVARVAPGKSYVLQLVFESGKKLGKFSNYILLKTNDPARPRIVIRFAGNLVQNLKVETYAIQSQVTRGQPYCRDLAVVTKTRGCRLVATATNNSNLEARIWQVNKDSDTENEWRLNLSTVGIFQGKLRAVCTLQYIMSDGQQGTLHIPVDLEEEPIVRLEPTIASLATIPNEYATAQSVASTSTTIKYFFAHGLSGRFLAAKPEDGLAGHIATTVTTTSGALHIGLFSPVETRYLPLKGAMQLLFSIDGIGDINVPLGIAIEPVAPIVVSPSTIYFQFPEGSQKKSQDTMLHVLFSKGLDGHFSGWHTDSSLMHEVRVTCETSKGSGMIRVIATNMGSGRGGKKLGRIHLQFDVGAKQPYTVSVPVVVRLP